MDSSPASSIVTSNWPGVHLYLSVNCTSGEYSLIRMKSISKAPAAVAQWALSATIVAFQVHGWTGIWAVRSSRTFLTDKIGLHVIAASASVARQNLEREAGAHGA